MDFCHVRQVAALEKRCIPNPWSEKSVASEMINPLSLWLVALEGDQVVGYIGSQTVLGETDMLNLAVAPEVRRQGIGRALEEALEAAIIARGSHRLSLEVRASNAPALALYAAAGFQQVGRRKDYYFHPREDALILRKEWCENEHSGN